MKDFESKIRKEICKTMDFWFERLCDNDFSFFGEGLTDDEITQIESIMASYKNVIAGIDWDGNKRSYEHYEV